VISLPVVNRSTAYEVRPTKIICLGLNYREHIAESHSVRVQGFTQEVPTEPVLFPKTPNVLIGPGEPIVIPAFLERYRFESPRVDHEAELAFFVRDRCRNVAPERAIEHIFGFTCMNDVSQRNVQTGDRSGWFRGKSFDTFGPVGPAVVLTEDIGDPQNLQITCRLNGKVTQSSNTRLMIFPITEILSFISRNFTLEPGDLILTGTPSGVSPLHHGDVVEVEIEKIGVLRNPVVEEARARPS
jgi:2-keto-4-pentenoate hydratase/2-oxohepta-3-ene-1,7-dioic acid hydratase in catechol pathway